MKQFALHILILLISSASLWADTDKETLIAITEITPTQYRMMVVQTVTTTVRENSKQKGSTDSLTYPGVVAEINGEEAVKEITDKSGNVVLSVSLRISSNDEGITAHYTLKHKNSDGTLAICPRKLKLK